MLKFIVQKSESHSAVMVPSIEYHPEAATILPMVGADPRVCPKGEHTGSPLQSILRSGIKFMLQFLIRLYQVLISPFLGPACRFHPSCSDYALESLERHGFFRAILDSIRRLARCHPFSKGGYDPVR